MKQFVVLGGGYGGTAVIHELFKGFIPSDIQVILVDRMPFQSLKTEYYALAAGTASDYELRVPFPSYSGLLMKYGEVRSIDLSNRTIHFQEGDQLEYDQLVIALGCTDNYHGIPGAEEHSFGIQSFAAVREAYLQLNNLKPYGKVNVIGGGLSGVEIAAELRESRPDLNIRIIDRGTRVLSAFPPKVSGYVTKWFEEHEVESLSSISTTGLDKGVIYHADGEIASDVTIWTAGIQPPAVVRKLDIRKDHQGRVLLNENYQIPEHPEVFVCGDCASLPFAPSTQAAEGQGQQVAQIASALWRGEAPRLQRLKLKGTLGSLGKKAGFGLMGKAQVTGRVPRILKSGVLWLSKHHIG
ncbi:NAD(P)/FAD-dependent oxidoreductase [Paenibacillus lentus]|uniref:NAD(P)/FAD-dependent oxidoreductase n=1 Tax=Paenibacillus lentus TaxID=1338368 RepID=A0A3Q8SAJ5_9BACL|nr:NAD(P)/FAD-dependent oxidoreductase [Paenibacillus lentus]AZK46262.1 NAD(P)/FAD-dependent oxidoreductase [Paenibacillus lentus]